MIKMIYPCKIFHFFSLFFTLRSISPWRHPIAGGFCSLVIELVDKGQYLTPLTIEECGPGGLHVLVF